MERTDIHKDQLKELEKLNAEQIINDLHGIVSLMEDRIQVNQNKMNIEQTNGAYILSNMIREHTKSLSTYFHSLGEI